MTNRLMISVAAIALIAGTGFANAQGTPGRESGGAAVQQGAPAPAGGAMQNRESSEPSATAPSGSSPGKKSTQSEQKSPTATKGQRAEDNQPGQRSKSMSSEETKGTAKDMKAEGREGRDNNMKAEGREGHDSNMKAEGREDRNKNAETKGTSERSQTTVGVAGAGAKLSTEQRTKITTVIRNQHTAPLNNVNFTIAVGTRVPHDVTFYPLPTEIVTIYPEWRGYEYIQVRDQILVIDPRSQEIVAVLDV